MKTILSLNNLLYNEAKNLLLRTDVDNILSVTTDGVVSTYATAEINVEGMMIEDLSKIPSIVFNGYSIIGTLDKDKLYGRYFYPRASTLDNTDTLCAVSIINALKNIGYISINYNITLEGYSTIKIKAKKPSPKYNIDIKFNNITINGYSHTDSTTNDELDSDNSSIYVDIYYNNTTSQDPINKDNSAEMEYLTTLKKTYYGKSVSFDLSGILSNITSYENTAEFAVKVYAMADNKYIDLGKITKNYIVNGYQVNKGKPYINLNNVNYKYSTYPLINCGESADARFNSDELFVYLPYYYITFARLNNAASETVNIKYLASDDSLIGEESHTVWLYNNLNNKRIDFNAGYFEKSAYIDLSTLSGTIRLTKINPPYANSECHRIYWLNSYGGISLFDFVGKQEIKYKNKMKTYTVSNLDYYLKGTIEKTAVYSRQNTEDITYTTHLMDGNGIKQLNDLASSYSAYIVIDDKKYLIIITSLDIQEVSTNIYTASITFNYSKDE